jgi:hypothetical protein
MATQVSLNSGAVASAGALALQTNGTTAAITLDTSQNATFAGKVTSAGALTLASNGTTTAATIDTSGNLGIGTSSPSKSGGSRTAITINGTTLPILEFSAGNTLYGYIYSNATQATINAGGGNAAIPLTFETNSLERMRLDSSGNFIYNQSSLACYVWTSFNPTNTSGTTTNAPATGTGYDTGFVTMVNSSGTLTITFDIAGKYLVSTNLQTLHANTYSSERSIFNLGGTATRATGTQDPTFSGIDSVDANTTATYPIYVSATAAQTITILPTYELTGTGTTTQHTCFPSVTIQYCGG